MGELVEFPRKELPATAAQFLEWARQIAVNNRPEMVGFFVLAWNNKGDTTICADTISPENPIPHHLLPSWIAEHARAELITGSEVRSILREAGLLAPKPPDKPA